MEEFRFKYVQFRQLFKYVSVRIYSKNVHLSLQIAHLFLQTLLITERKWATFSRNFSIFCAVFQFPTCMIFLTSIYFCKQEREREHYQFHILFMTYCN